MRLKLLLILFAWVTSASALAAVDCSRTRDNLDKLVCSSSRLSVAEEQMASSFHAARRRGVDMQMLQSTHIEWYEQVRNACNDVACLLRAFDERSAELDNY